MVNNKLPRCFSIPDEDLSPKRKMSTKKDLNSTLDATFRKIHSEQVSPRTQPKIANSKAISIKSNNDEKLKNWNSDHISISKNEWNDSTRFAPIISSIIL